MSCCGQKRNQTVSRAMPVHQRISPVGSSAFNRSSTSQQVASFEYIGKTALTAIGPVSGRHYRFSYPGAVVEVDAGDAPSLATVPTLRKTVSR